MGKLDDMFMEEKKNMKNMTAPDEFESRLREALKNKVQKPKRDFRRWAAAAVVAILIGGYGFDAAAYYTKKILGYENIMQGNLGRLNELGKGQEINQSCTFSDGTEVTLDEVFFDENKLVGLFRIKGDNDDLPSFELSGLRKYSPESGRGKVDGDTMYFVQEFKAPDFYEKWMKVDISRISSSKMENREIKFTLNRNKAINLSVKQNINKDVDIAGTTVKFQLISGSPLSIRVSGSITKGFLEATDGKAHKSVEFDLYINGKKQTILGGGMSSGLKTEFYSEFEGVDGSIGTMEIRNIRLVEWEMADKSVPVDYTIKDNKLQLGKTPVTIKSMTFDGENTILRMETPSNVEIPLGLIIGNSQLDNIDEEYKETLDKAEQIYRFKGRGENMKLLVKGVNHLQKSSEIIEIPVEK